ncbi:MAG: transglycosylase domain-containing protein [Clostridia bacterium]
MFKLIKRIIVIILVVILIGTGFIIYQGHKLYKDALYTISLSEKIAQIQADNSYVKLNSLPVDYKNAVISVEDHRFYKHGPIDVIAIARAIFSNVRSGELLEGGSTITQQVAKNLYFISADSNSLYRKIAEIFMAYDLEKAYEKDEILEFYINTIYFGDGYYGIEEACNGYLDKNAKDMNLYEATMMAGIPNAPSVYAPTANLDLTLSRQRKVISTMVENEYIIQEKADELIAMQH